MSSWAHCLERTALPVEAAEVPATEAGEAVGVPVAVVDWAVVAGEAEAVAEGEAEAEAAVEGGAEVAGAPEGGAEVGAGWAVEAAVEPGLKAREAATVNGRPDRSPQNNARPKGEGPRPEAGFATRRARR